jgi:uncharacterized protein YdbL (DUF1318 family)
MNRALLVLIAVACAFAAAPTAGAQSREELQKRFKERFPTLVKLKNAEKVGENWEGYAEVVKASYADEKLNPKDDKSETIREFLALENKDRTLLYEALAKDKPVKPAEVGQTNAKRNFEKAAPDDYLKTKDGKWVKRKDAKLEKEEKKDES